MVMLSNRSFKLYETVIVGYSTLVMRSNKHWNLWNIDTRELEKTEHKLIFINA